MALSTPDWDAIEISPLPMALGRAINAYRDLEERNGGKVAPDFTWVNGWSTPASHRSPMAIGSRNTRNRAGLRNISVSSWRRRVCSITPPLARLGPGTGRELSAVVEICDRGPPKHQQRPSGSRMMAGLSGWSAMEITARIRAAFGAYAPA